MRFLMIPRLALKAEAVGLFDALKYRPARVATARIVFAVARAGRA